MSTDHSTLMRAILVAEDTAKATKAAKTTKDAKNAKDAKVVKNAKAVKAAANNDADVFEAAADSEAAAATAAAAEAAQEPSLPPGVDILLNPERKTERRRRQLNLDAATERMFANLDLSSEVKYLYFYLCMYLFIGGKKK